ncbi:Uu.00g082000.m01.CDS01 [Anthostomella pinea]|uniref:Ubiquitin-like 1-activating enzyme E1A n=1 Tax=Anthostomella pinea TaxID=933095 RepID=A0AAI8VL99_9PEZI|nr:Uu.00g082000.m01.CDS01 [Anthostomella pinea]
MATAEQTVPAESQAPTAVPEQQPAQDSQMSGQDSQAGVAPSTEAVTDQTAQANGLMFPNQGTALAVPPGPTNNSNGTFPPLSTIATAEQPTNGPNGANAKQGATGQKMTADEIALYDRQIRLWGMQAQQKIQGAHILLITMKALANEIAKNLVLAGIGSLTIVDDQIVTEADLGSQFFLSQENIGQTRAVAAAGQIQKLNPRVKVYPDPDSIMNKGASYFSAFDIVIATDLNPTLLAFINTATRLHNIQFYAAGSHGFYGYIFCDLIEHDYVLKRDKGNGKTALGPEDGSRTRSVTEFKTQREGNKTIELVSKRELYSTWDLASETSALPSEYLKSKRRLKAVTPALSCLRALWSFQQMYSRYPNHTKQDLEFFTRTATHNHQLLSLPAETLRSEFLRSFLQNIGSEMAPVAAILGGQLAQDVINVLGQNQQPIQNMVVFDGNKMEANMYAMHPEGNLGRAQLELTTPAPASAPMGQVGMPQMLPLGQTNNSVPGSATQSDGFNQAGSAELAAFIK